MNKEFKEINDFIRSLYNDADFIPLHVPSFSENEKKYLVDCIDSTFVSSVGKYVDQFEENLKDYSKAEAAVAVVNGTAALHAALKLVDVFHNDEVITQPITFIATCNAISYCGAHPLFIDVDIDTLGLSPEKLDAFLDTNAQLDKNGNCINRISKRKISACVPMHTFGHPCRIDEIVEICNKWNIEVIEDAAESLGSTYKEKHTGLFGRCGVISFNGNKIITSGGGGMIITFDKELGKKAKHITTTAKVPHKWEYVHDEIGFNYRMPNVNAALGCAQMERLPDYMNFKRDLALKYKRFFENLDIEFIMEPAGANSNYWLNAVKFKNYEERNEFLSITNDNGIQTRPVWKMINKLAMYSNCLCDDLSNSEEIEDRIVNIPSSVIL